MKAQATCTACQTTFIYAVMTNSYVSSIDRFKLAMPPSFLAHLALLTPI